MQRKSMRIFALCASLLVLLQCSYPASARVVMRGGMLRPTSSQNAPTSLQNAATNLQNQLQARERRRDMRRLQAGIPRLSQILNSSDFLHPPPLMGLDTNAAHTMSGEVPASRFSGKTGILIVAGGPTSHLGNALVSLRILRESLDCKLPVEIVYFGEQERDLPMQNLIMRQVPGVEFVDGSTVPYPKHHQKGVLMLDADSMPLVAPEEMFKVEQYSSRGNLFWPDFWSSPDADNSEEMFNMEQYSSRGKLFGPDFWSSPDADNSGRHSGGLLYRALKMRPPWATNPNHRLTESGQDTFLLAFHLAGISQDFNQVGIPPREAVNDLSEPKQFPYRHQGILQHLPDGRIAFHHRTAPDVKFFPGCGQNSMFNWCRIAYISTPLSVLQARGLINKTHEGRFSLTEMDAGAAEKLHCQHISAPMSPPPQIAPYIQRMHDNKLTEYLMSDLYIPLVPKLTVRGQTNAEEDTGGQAAPFPIFKTSRYTRVGPLLEAAFLLYTELKDVVDSMR
eukprot:gene22129-29190_t